VSVPFPLDYVEVLDSLCHVLSLLYYKFQNEALYTNQQAFDALVKVDLKVKHHIVNPIAKEFTELSLRIVKEELDWVRQDTGL
jgi:hypothetical protein